MPDGVVSVEHGGHFELGTHAVGARHEDRSLHTRDVGTEQAAEAAYVRKDTVCLRAGHHGPDAGNQLVAGTDIDAG